MSTYRRGRPPLSPDDESTPVCLKLPTELYDRLDAAARAERPPISVPELIRRAIARVIPAPAAKAATSDTAGPGPE